MNSWRIVALVGVAMTVLLVVASFIRLLQAISGQGNVLEALVLTFGAFLMGRLAKVAQQKSRQQ